LLPLAFADFFTGFSSATEADLAKLFDNGMNADLIHCYWESRAAVKTAAGAEKKIYNAKTSMAIALGVNSSQLEEH